MRELKRYVEIPLNPPSQMWGLFELAHEIFMVQTAKRGANEATLHHINQVKFSSWILEQVLGSIEPPSKSPSMQVLPSIEEDEYAGPRRETNMIGEGRGKQAARKQPRHNTEGLKEQQTDNHERYLETQRSLKAKEEKLQDTRNVIARQQFFVANDPEFLSGLTAEAKEHALELILRRNQRTILELEEAISDQKFQERLLLEDWQ